MAPTFHPRPGLALAALLSLLLAGCHPASPTAAAPAAAADSFFATVARGDTRAAYDASSFGFQAAQSQPSFDSNAHELGLVGAQLPLWSGTTAGQKQATLTGALTTATGEKLGLTVLLARDGGTYKVHQIRTSAGAASQNRFTVIGKGFEFKDVYHQPIPPADKLAALVQDTMARFQAGIHKGSFDDLFQATAEGWKHGDLPHAPDRDGLTHEHDLDRVTKVEADGQLTEPILRNHFQAFIDKQIDLSYLTGQTPAFDRPPYVDSLGYLVLIGHYNPPPYRTEFDLRYVYEVPRWRLASININILK